MAALILTDLLPECLRHICSYLGPCSLLSLACVSRALVAPAHDERVWLPHAERVVRELGAEFRVGAEKEPTWMCYRRVLLSPWSPYNAPFIVTELVVLNGRDTRIETVMRRASILKLSKAATTDRINVDIVQRWDDRDDILLVHLSAYPPLGGRHAMSFTTGNNNTLALSGSFYVGRTYYLAATVHSIGWRRFHSVVRGSDCLGVREERTWLVIE